MLSKHTSVIYLITVVYDGVCDNFGWWIVNLTPNIAQFFLNEI